MPISLSLGLSLSSLLGSPSYTFVNPQAQALVARFTTPPTYARAALIDAFVGALLAASVWGKLDAMWVMAAADAQAATQAALDGALAASATLRASLAAIETQAAQARAK